MDLQNTRFPFYTTLLEWYEFTIYNLLIPYGIFGGSSSTSIYIAFIIFALSFAARPIGAVYFSSFSNRTIALQRSLLLMLISTTMMALAPLNFGIITTVWFTICKFAQGISIGGSYGLSFLSVYDREELSAKKHINYKLGIVQTGWVWGMLAGQMTVFLVKLLYGNLNMVTKLLSQGEFYKILAMAPSKDFISWGWRIPFLVSIVISAVLYLVARGEKFELVTRRKHILLQIVQFIRNNRVKFIAILTIASIDMVISHLWFTYGDVVREVGQTQLIAGVFSTIRYICLLILIPLVGKAVDRLNAIFRGLNGNYLMLLIVFISMAFFGSYAPWPGLVWAFVSTLYAGFYFGAIAPLIISLFPKMDRQMMVGPTFNIVSALVGGAMPLAATIISKRFGDARVGMLMTVSSVLAIIGLIYSRFTTNMSDRD